MRFSLAFFALFLCFAFAEVTRATIERKVRRRVLRLLPRWIPLNFSYENRSSKKPGLFGRVGAYVEQGIQWGKAKVGAVCGLSPKDQNAKDKGCIAQKKLPPGIHMGLFAVVPTTPDLPSPLNLEVAFALPEKAATKGLPVHFAVRTLPQEVHLTPGWTIIAPPTLHVQKLTRIVMVLAQDEHGGYEPSTLLRLQNLFDLTGLH